MRSKSPENRPQKIPGPSIELTCVILSAMLFAIEDKDRLMNLVPQVYAEPGKKETLSILEGVLTKNLDQAVRFVCLLGLGEKLLTHEESPRAKVSLVYLVSRSLFKEDQELTKKDSEQLWRNVWSFASQISSVASEMDDQARCRNLKNWQSEVQTYARRRWRTLRDEQTPRVKEQIKDLQNRVLAFLNIKREPSS